jgi:hypothetical protein
MLARLSSLSCGFTTAILALAIHASAVDAGHYDVVPYASGTGSGASLLTGGHDDLGGLPTLQSVSVFGYDFGETDAYFAGDPGFNNGSAFTASFPNSGKLPAGTLRLNLFNGPYSTLNYWDGNGSAAFSPVTGGVEINLNKGSSNLRIGATTISGSLAIGTIAGSGGAAGRIHQHLQSSIGVGGTGESWTTLGGPDGIYAFGATLSVADLVSAPIYFVFNQGMDEAIHDAGISFYESLNGQGVPEIDPAGMGSVLALVTGALGLLDRRRLKVKSA